MDKNYAIITGASSGIGLEMTKILAKKRYNLVLVSRDKKSLDKLATGLKKKFKINIIVFPLDLSDSKAPNKLFSEVKKQKLPIEILINNAGFGSFGEFKKLPLKRELEMVDLNIKALMSLSHLFLKSLIKTKGYLLNVSSIAAYQPIPTMATYAATKSFVSSFSMALNRELEKEGVSVTALCPGPTKTNFTKVAIMRDFKGPKVMTSYQVAKLGIEGMFERKSVIITGSQNKIGTVFAKLLPSKLSARVVEKIMNK